MRLRWPSRGPDGLRGGARSDLRRRTGACPPITNSRPPCRPMAPRSPGAEDQAPAELSLGACPYPGVVQGSRRPANGWRRSLAPGQILVTRSGASWRCRTDSRACQARALCSGRAALRAAQPAGAGRARACRCRNGSGKGAGGCGAGRGRTGAGRPRRLPKSRRAAR